MPLVRSKFKKYGEMIYISHLDVLRLFERTMRRAGIKPAFTQGFNKHPKISFAQALSLGMPSCGEYVDIEIESNIGEEEFRSMMNKCLPEGIEFVKSRIIDKKSPALMGIVTHARYMIMLNLENETDEQNIRFEIKSFMEIEEIVVDKRTKKGKIKQINIRPMIRDIGITNVDGKSVYLNAVLATGSSGNLKPEILLNSILEKTSLKFNIADSKIQRQEIYVLEDGTLNTPI